jgi:YggT family protein
MFKPDWRPRGLMLPIAEIIFLFTDPPLKLARRVIPPLRMGAVGVDLSYIAVFFGLSIIENIILKVIPVK